MRIALLNTVYGVTSVGRIMADLTSDLKAKGHEVLPIYGREPVLEALRPGSFSIEDQLGIRWHGLMTRLFDRHGLDSVRATRKLLRRLDEFQPELLWLHNLHGYYINFPLLFRWIKAHPDLQVRWTLHDCWSFTGHCAHFSAYGCDLWKTECAHCPLKASYPKSYLLNRSRQNYRIKKKCFTGVKHLTLQVPSCWLEKLVRQSFLKDYPVEVVPNSIDRSIFKPVPGNFRKQYGLENRIIVLAVGTVWSENKGMKDYLSLSRMLDERFQLVLVGMSPKEIEGLPKNILGIPRTDSAKALAEIYTAADVLISASREEVFGMTILEAHACGTPAIVYEGTACEEVAKGCKGKAVPMRVEALAQALMNFAEEKQL